MGTVKVKLLNDKVSVDEAFEEYMDTDLGGPGVQAAMERLISDYTKLIKKQIPKEDQAAVRQAVKKYWIGQLQDWKKL